MTKPLRIDSGEEHVILRFVCLGVEGGSVEGAEVFCMGEVELLGEKGLELVEDLLVGEGSSLGGVAAAPLIDAKGFGVASGPDRNAAVADGGECERSLLEFGEEVIQGARIVDENVDADCFL